jgi:hypothetical protein
MLPEKPGLWLVGEGRYYVNSGESGPGCIVRINHKISSLENVKNEMIKQIEYLNQRETDLKNSLQENCPYSAKMMILKRKLSRIDKILEL